MRYTSLNNIINIQYLQSGLQYINLPSKPIIKSDRISNRISKYMRLENFYKNGLKTS